MGSFAAAEAELLAQLTSLWGDEVPEENKNSRGEIIIEQSAEQLAAI
jgi:hypothetical protein